MAKALSAPSLNSRFNQGYFTPKYPKKYVGDVEKIRYMSSWELSFNTFLDSNPNILQWSSEPVAIEYLKPTTKKIHRYFPDYWLKVKTRTGAIKQFIIEIKPESQTKPSKSRRSKTKLIENVTYAINVAKWQAAQHWCNKHGVQFLILTEKQLFSAFKTG